LGAESSFPQQHAPGGAADLLGRLADDSITVPMSDRAWNDPSFRTLPITVSLATFGAFSMGSTADKASGLANEVAGKAKQGIGNVVGSDKLKSEGAAQELKGDVQKATGDAKAAVKDAANKATDAVDKKL
jgi:uncharacterized protein YjbJ (UPF0337 family)